MITVTTLATTKRYVSQWHYDSAGRYLADEPALGFDFNRRAYEAFPYDPIPRRQLFVSLLEWAASGVAIPFSIDQQEAVYRISASAGPAWPGLSISRIHQMLDRCMI